MFGIQRHNRLPPVARKTTAKSRSPRLPFTILRPNSQNLHVKQLFDRSANIDFGRQPINLERICIVPRATMHTLFRHQGPQNNLMRLQMHARFRTELAGRLFFF